MSTHHRHRQSHHNSHLYFRGIMIGILFLFCFISIGLALSIHFRPLYYANIEWLKLSEVSGFSSAVIRENYDALIDYCSPFFFGRLSFPSLPASASGLSHFAEVKVIFLVLYTLGLISFLLLLMLLVYKRNKRHKAELSYLYNNNFDYSFIKVSAITTLVLPMIIGLACAINFDITFQLFHKIAFRNDDWLFDPATDPIILLLPQEYFLQCALIIIFFVLFGAAAQFLCYLRLQKRTSIKPVFPSVKNYYY